MTVFGSGHLSSFFSAGFWSLSSFFSSACATAMVGVLHDAIFDGSEPEAKYAAKAKQPAAIQRRARFMGASLSNGADS